GTKPAAHYVVEVPAGGQVVLRLRLTTEGEAGGPPAGPEVDRIFADRMREADTFYARNIPAALGEGEQAVVRQAYASLLWSKKFFHYVVKDWLEGDPAQPSPPARMGFFCVTLLEMALELAREDPACEDMASKYFEHFIAIVDAMNTFGGSGLWCPEDGFYYDQLQVGGRVIPLRVRSMVGLLPLMACTVLDEAVLERFPAFTKRMRWFLENRPDLARFVPLAVAEHVQRLIGY